MSVKDLIAASYCISINPIRAKQINCVFRKIFGSAPHIVRGYRSSRCNGIENCAMAHQTIVRMAKAAGLDHVLIFEDDAYPRHDAAARIEKAILNTPDDAKIVVLGFNQVNSARQFNSELSLISPREGLDFSVWGSQSYIIYRNAYDEYLDIWEKNPGLSSDGYFSRISPAYVSKNNIFIQMCSERSMNGHSGYIWGNKSHDAPPDGFNKREEYLAK